jgi:MYXO-CTERM domain-containing protein
MDGGAWSEPSYGGRIDVTTYGGAHVVEIAALDHDGNLDPSPLQLPLRVDTNMPQLVITEQPEPMLETDSATVGFAARDDRTPTGRLVYTAQLYRVPDGGGNPALLQSRILRPGQLSVTFADLADGVYNIRVIVADGVGNVTSQDVGFVVAAEGGCSLTPTGSGGGPGAPTGLLVLALVAVLFIARRRDG